MIIEPFSQWKLNKIKTENCMGSCGCSWVLLEKPLVSQNLIEFTLQFSELRFLVEDIYFWVDFVAGNFYSEGFFYLE
jgi:hypothetical protein